MEDAEIKIQLILTDAALAGVLEAIVNKSVLLLASEPEAHYETLKAPGAPSAPPTPAPCSRLSAANSASAVTVYRGKNPHRGLPAPVEHRLGGNSPLSPDRLSEKPASLYDPASDFAVAARGSAERLQTPFGQRRIVHGVRCPRRNG
jgi:hypothetical protein